MGRSKLTWDFRINILLYDYQLRRIAALVTSASFPAFQPFRQVQFNCDNETSFIESSCSNTGRKLGTRRRSEYLVTLR